MTRSTVVDNDNGGSVLHDIRTSSGTFLAPDQDAIIANIQRRVAEFSMVPRENQESMQVLHYGLNEKYGAHMDTFDESRTDPGWADNGKQRIATALLFLSAPLSGGETAFPNVAVPDQGDGWSRCARGSLAHKPAVGDLILFWNLTPEGEVDLGATHAACPVIEGEKWSAPIWMHQGAFQPRAAAVRAARASPDGVRVAGDGQECVDEEAMCRTWAAAGECESNAEFMVGVPSEGFVGRCRVACSACPHPRALVPAVVKATA
jgi:prolyl 4-hydroxylase